MKKSFLYLVCVFFTFSSFAQTEEKRTFAELKKLVIKGNFDVILEASDVNFVQFKSETNITSDKILTSVKNDELSVSINDKVKPNKLGKVVLIVGYKKLKALEIEDFASLTVKDKLDLDELDLAFGGNTQSVLDGKIKNLKVKIKDKASLKISGECKNFEIEGKEDAFLTATEFVCEAVKISVKGKGSYLINAVKDLNASMNGEGEIVYKGQPKKMKIDTKGGGVIKPLQ
jgi:hypothetical protein